MDSLSFHLVQKSPVTSEKDDPQYQRDRIERIVGELIPDCTVVFDLDQPPNWLRFKIDAPSTGTILGVSGHHHASEVADWSDEYLRGYIRAIAPSFAR